MSEQKSSLFETQKLWILTVWRWTPWAGCISEHFPYVVGQPHHISLLLFFSFSHCFRFPSKYLHASMLHWALELPPKTHWSLSDGHPTTPQPEKGWCPIYMEKEVWKRIWMSEKGVHNSTILKIVDPYKPVVLSCDCLEFALDAVFSQQCKKYRKLPPLAYLAKSLIKWNQKYEMFVRECSVSLNFWKNDEITLKGMLTEWHSLYTPTTVTLKSSCPQINWPYKSLGGQRHWDSWPNQMHCHKYKTMSHQKKTISAMKNCSSPQTSAWHHFQGYLLSKASLRKIQLTWMIPSTELKSMDLDLPTLCDVRAWKFWTPIQKELSTKVWTDKEIIARIGALTA